MNIFVEEIKWQRRPAKSDEDGYVILFLPLKKEEAAKMNLPCSLVIEAPDGLNDEQQASYVCNFLEKEYNHIVESFCIRLTR